MKQALAKALLSECYSTSLEEFQGLCTTYWYGGFSTVFPRSVVFVGVQTVQCSC